MAKKKNKRPFDYLLDPEIEALQPDYAAWRAVQLGMTVAEAVAILGPPMQRPPIIAENVFEYGYLQFPLMPSPRWYSFALHFAKERLFYKEDPFDGELSLDGFPTKPRIITPQEGTVFRYPWRLHRQQLFDIRWHPASGVYPMMYEIEIGAKWTHRDDPFTYFVYPTKTQLLYYVDTDRWAGLPGCIRIRGVNEVGTGEWSDFRHFDFDVSVPLGDLAIAMTASSSAPPSPRPPA